MKETTIEEAAVIYICLSETFSQKNNKWDKFYLPRGVFFTLSSIYCGTFCENS